MISELRELKTRIRKDKRNRRDRARRRFKKWLREVEERAEKRVHVRACIDCGSTQLCEPECGLAPWNIKEE